MEPKTTKSGKRAHWENWKLSSDSSLAVDNPRRSRALRLGHLSATP